jgi:hypothetical protein
MNSPMKANKYFITVALALAVFFLSQFAAELFFLAGPRPGTGKKTPERAFDPKAFSLSSRLHTETAFAWLEAGTRDSDESAVKMSMVLLGRALRHNPLDYQARYYLAKAYLQFSAVDNDYFDLGVRELKRAASIRGSNKQIALDCARVFFSLWPLLETADKTFASDLLFDDMPTLSVALCPGRAPAYETIAAQAGIFRPGRRPAGRCRHPHGRAPPAPRPARG